MAKTKGFILDTHIFIWWMDKDKRLRKEVITILRDHQFTVFLSIASIWEMIIKKGKGKLVTSIDIEEGIKASGFSLLPIELSHVLTIDTLPLHHKDPFDRILIAQAIKENLVLITDDVKMRKYKVKIFT